MSRATSARAPSGSRRYRLAGAGEFDALFRRARRRDGHYLQVLWLPAVRDPGRAGFAIGAKTLPRAVDRNRLRRMLRERLRRARPEIESCDVILRLKRSVPPARFVEVADEASRLLAALAAEASQR